MPPRARTTGALTTRHDAAAPATTLNARPGNNETVLLAAYRAIALAASEGRNITPAAVAAR